MMMNRSLTLLSRFRFHTKNIAVRNASYALVFETYGEPTEVLKKVPITNERVLKNNDVMIRYLASPINPADINTIQGVYPVKPSFPAIGGNEGVAQVVRVGANVKTVQPGDKVLPAARATGTWTTHAVLPEKDLIVVDRDVDDLFASQILVNPCTAYRMLKDFHQFEEPGQSVIQNGANSAVGLYVIQLAKLWNIKTINVIRDRPDGGELRNRLRALGADYVVTEEELRKKEVMDKILAEIPKPKLAFNCVGGQNATDCMRYLSDEGIMVTYGGMSRKPVVIPTGLLIFKDQKYVGFWMTRWAGQKQNASARLAMIQELCQLRKEGKLITPNMREVSLDDYKKTFEEIARGFSDAKFVFRKFD